MYASDLIYRFCIHYGQFYLLFDINFLFFFTYFLIFHFRELVGIYLAVNNIYIFFNFSYLSFLRVPQHHVQIVLSGSLTIIILQNQARIRGLILVFLKPIRYIRLREIRAYFINKGILAKSDTIRNSSCSISMVNVHEILFSF